MRPIPTEANKKNERQRREEVSDELQREFEYEQLMWTPAKPERGTEILDGLGFTVRKEMVWRRCEDWEEQFGVTPSPC